MPYALLVSNFKLSGGELALVDAASGTSILLKNLNLSSGGISFDASFPVDIAGDFVQDTTNCHFAGTTVIDLKTKAIELKDVSLTAQNATLHLSGTLSNVLDPAQSSISLNVQGDRQALDALVALIPGAAGVQLLETARVNINLSGNQDKLKIIVKK
jgi:hypothetical protein